MKQNALIFTAGVLFGIGLAISGMTNPAIVIGFLDVAGNWDATLVFVMLGAVSVFGIGTWLTRGLPKTEQDPISRRLVFGSMIFGVGWGLSGFCPGPAIANLAAWRTESLWFVPAMALGMILAQRIFRLDG